VDRPDFAEAKAFAEGEAARGDAYDASFRAVARPSAMNFARAYLSLLEAVEPLLAAADDTAIGDAEFVRIAAGAASALRDLLGPTGGEA